MGSDSSFLPGGTVTFLFTDIEGSTELLKHLGDQYATLLADQRHIQREIFTRWNGQEVDTQGDSFFLSFPRASDAVAAAVEAQKALAEHDWTAGVEVRVRMGLHTGQPLIAQEGYVGMDVHRAARIASVGHGGQVLLSATTTPLILDDLPEGVTLLDLGRHRLKDMRRPEHISQLVIEGLPSKFPNLKSLEALPPEISLENISVKTPTFLEAEELEVAAPVFVGRERELVRMGGFLEDALTGKGLVAFMTGGPGRGKTALMDAFARKIVAKHSDLLVARGSCCAHTGIGDPYLPFREVMEMLTGDLEAHRIAGRIQRENAIRLWGAMPKAIQALVEYGPDLIDVFVSGNVLLARARAALEDGGRWLERLATLCVAERKPLGELRQTNLFEQYEDVLGEIAGDLPLVLLLDDLQWADSASINLLFHLSRQLAGKRIMIVGAYRPEEVALGRGGEVHPLEKVLAEVKRQYGNVYIDLSEVSEEEERQFVEGYLDIEPNRLSEGFRQALYDHTDGHPLFTVELLRNLQERGDLLKDDEGLWIEGPALNWTVLPARVEGVIEERIGRLEETLRETLRIASVEGENFTAQVVACVQKVGELELFGKLNRELEKRHRLVHSRGEVKVGEKIISQYAFSHAIFQQFLYNGLSSGERRLIHGEVARILEELYAGKTEIIVVQLAQHYAEAYKSEKAIEYLRLAGDLARQSYAYQEAIDAYEHALIFLREQREHLEAGRILMQLGLLYHSTFDFERSRKAYQEGFTLRQRAHEAKPLTPPQPAPHAYRHAFMNFETLDPTLVQDEQTSTLVDQLFCGLVEMRGALDIVPHIAHSWDVLENGRKYIFHLRNDFCWTDGHPVTARDFEYAWKRVLDPEIDSPTASWLYDISGAKAFHQGEDSNPDAVGVKAVDDHTLMVELEAPTSYFLYLVAFSVTYPIPSHVIEEVGENWTDQKHLVTNGPFTLDRLELGKKVLLKRNPNYPGQFDGNLLEVELLVSTDWEENVQRYERGELEILSGIPVSEYERMRQRYANDYITGPFPNTTYLNFNIVRPPLDDSRVRKAIAHAIDRDHLANVVLRGYSDPATGGFVPPGIPGHTPDIALPYDPSLGKQLIEEAGYSKCQDLPIIQIYSVDSPNYRSVTEAVKDQMKENLGIETEITHFNFPQIVDSITQDEPHIFVTGWNATYPDPDDYLRIATRTRLQSKWSERYDKLVDDARRVSDQFKRMKMYEEAEKILAEEVKVLPLLYTRFHLFVKPWVKKFSIQPPRVFSFKDIVIESD